MGFGLAAVVFAPLKRSMIDQWAWTGLSLCFPPLWAQWRLSGRGSSKIHPMDTLPPNEKQQPAGSQLLQWWRMSLRNRFIRTPVFYLLWVALAMGDRRRG